MIEQRRAISERNAPMPPGWGIFLPQTLEIIKNRQGCHCANCGAKEDRNHGVYIHGHHIIPRSIAWNKGFKESSVASAENGVGLCESEACHPRFNEEAYNNGTIFQEILLAEQREYNLIRFRVPRGAIDGRRFRFDPN